MRILLQTTWFSLQPGDGNMVNELALALAADGHDVQVVLLDWNAVPGTPTKEINYAERVAVLAIAPRALSGLGTFIEKGSKWLTSSWFAVREMRRVVKGQTYDLHIGFSPASVASAQNLLARRICKRSYMILWDFFPYHHRSLGLVSNGIVFRTALAMETALLKTFDTIGCMTPANLAYLKAHYKLSPSHTLEIMPIWGDTTPLPVAPRDEVRRRLGLPIEKKIAVFGGTLSEGRGLDDILAAAKVSETLYPEINYLIIGDGRLAPVVQQRVEQAGSNIVYRRRVPRSDYLQLLTACDAGLVCTVRNVDVPTFPSKTIDYLRAAVPIAASVEASTDYGAFIEANKVGKACLAGDGAALAETVAKVVYDVPLNADLAVVAAECLRREFDVKNIVAQLMRNAKSTQVVS